MLDGVLHHKKLTVRGQKRAEVYLQLADLSRLIQGMIHHAQKRIMLKERNQELRKLAEQAIFERKSTFFNAA